MRVYGNVYHVMVNSPQNGWVQIRVSSRQANTPEHMPSSLLWLCADLLSRCVQSDRVQVVLTGALNKHVTAE